MYYTENILIIVIRRALKVYTIGWFGDETMTWIVHMVNYNNNRVVYRTPYLHYCAVPVHNTTMCTV